MITGIGYGIKKKDGKDCGKKPKTILDAGLDR